MKKRTRTLVLNTLTGLAIAATAAFLLAPGSADAAEARTNGPITLLSGPGYGYGPVGNIGADQRVTVGPCQAAFCSVSFGGLSGWAPRQRLDMKIGTTNDGSFGSGSVSIGIGVGAPPAYIPEGPSGPDEYLYDQGGPDYYPPTGGGFGDYPGDRRHGPDFADTGDVCFFTGFNYRGASFCLNAGDSEAFLGDWSNTIRSIDNPDGYDVRVCINPDFRTCRVYTSSARSLGSFDMAISSASVD